MQTVGGFNLAELLAQVQQTPPGEEARGESGGPQRRSSAMQSNEQLERLKPRGASPVSGGPTRSASPSSNESPIDQLSSGPLTRSSLPIVRPRPLQFDQVYVPEWLKSESRPSILGDAGHSGTESVSPSES
jgi:hypothetical protein